MKNEKIILRDITWTQHQGEIFGQILDEDRSTILILGRITPNKRKTKFSVMCTIPYVGASAFKKTDDLKSAKQFLSKRFKKFVENKAAELKNYIK